MERREFLKVLPLAAIAPKVVKEGVLSLELPPGHYVILADPSMVDIRELAETPGRIIPPGSTGGYIIPIHGNPDEAIKFYKLKESDKLPPLCENPEHIHDFASGDDCIHVKAKTAL